MKPSELRIGNWVINKTYPGDENPVQIDTLHDFFDQYPVVRINGDHPDHISPIPLTDEWLLKFGFFLKEEIYNEHFFKGALFQDRNSDEFVIHHGDEYHYIRDISSSAFDGSTEYRTTKIQYVHQLQNLYFALTGEELEIK